MSFELQRRRILDARAENLMVLLADSHRIDRRQLAFYRPRSGVLGRRDAYPLRFLREPRTRNLLRLELTSEIRQLVRHDRWTALHWLLRDFPRRHMEDAPPTGRDDVDATIRSAIIMASTGGGGQTPDRGTDAWRVLHGMRPLTPLERQAKLFRSHGLLPPAELIPEIDESSIVTYIGARAHLLRELERRVKGMYGDVYEGVVYQGVGGHGDAQAANWADRPWRFVLTILEIMHPQRTPSGLLSGATAAKASVARAALEAWRGLPREAAELLYGNEKLWYLLLSDLWEQVKRVIDWGFRRVGYESTANTFMAGRFANPNQDLLWRLH